MKTWIVFASGGQGDDAWDEEKEVQARSIGEAIDASGFDEQDIDGIISEDLADELELEPDPDIIEAEPV